MPIKQEITRLRAEVASAALIADNTKALKEEIASLRSEVAELRASLEPLPRPDPSAASSSTGSLARVLKSSVKCALQDMTVKKEVILYLPENKRDHEDIDSLCQKASVTVKPSAIERIGRPKNDRTRPLKASFPTPFDARTFMTRINLCKANAETEDPIRKIRCRPCRTQEEQKRYSAHAKEVREMNEAAKDAGDESYSIRQNGEVWKYKNGVDGWKRVVDWVFTPSTLENSENGAR